MTEETIEYYPGGILEGNDHIDQPALVGGYPTDHYEPDSIEREYSYVLVFQGTGANRYMADVGYHTATGQWHCWAS